MIEEGFEKINSNNSINQAEDSFNFADLARAEDELYSLQEKNLPAKRSILYRIVDSYFAKQTNRQKHIVSRKKYLWLCILTGWFGGHRFYEKRYKLALIYLLFAWTGIPIAMTMVDWMIALPITPDENGNILI